MKRKHTILVIPSDGSPTRQFHISPLGKRYLSIGAILLGGLITVLLVYDVYQWNYIQKQEAAYARVNELEASLADKDKEIARLAEQSVQMANGLTEIESLEKKIASILKLPSPPTTAAPSRGTTASPQSYIPSQADKSANLVAAHVGLWQQYNDETVAYQDRLDHTPSILPIEGNIVSSFGYRRNPFGGWSSEFHNGVDIACDYGTPVRAPADGVVTFAGWHGGYGRKIQIDHGNGIATLYGHNSRLLVKSGDNVKKGDIIAYSGNSGRSTGSHLHYAASVNGQAVDPLMFTNPTKEQ